MNGESPLGFYERCAVTYLENKPTPAYMDILARQTLNGSTRSKQEFTIFLAGLAEFASAKYIRIAAAVGLSRDDLRQTAMCEMLASLRTWNPDRCPFQSYAYMAAIFGIRRALGTANLVRVPSHARRAALNGGTYRGQGPMRPHTRAAAIRALQASRSLTGLPSDDEATVDLPVFEDGYEEVATELSIEQAMRAANITYEQRTALEASYGEGGTKEQRIRALAAELGTSEHSVRHTAGRALRKLRTAMGVVEQPISRSKDDGHKKCGECGELKPTSEYYRRSRDGGLQTACKKCFNARSTRNKRKRRAERKASNPRAA